MEEIKKTFSELLTDENFTVEVDRRNNTLKVTDLELELSVWGRCNIKNRHHGKLQSMVASAKKLEIDDLNKKTGVFLNEYNEETDPSLYVQLTYLDGWDVEKKMSKDAILDADVEGNALRKFAHCFLKVNAILKDKEAEAKN